MTDQPPRRQLDGYAALATVTGRVWPVPFSLRSSTRERHLHHALTDAGIRYPVATTARDHSDDHHGNPAGPVWWLHRHDGPLLRMAALPHSGTARRAA